QDELGIEEIQNALIEMMLINKKRTQDVKNYRKLRAFHQEIQDKMGEYFMNNVNPDKIFDYLSEDKYIFNFLESQEKVRFDIEIGYQRFAFMDLQLYKHTNHAGVCEIFLDKKKVRSERKIAFIKGELESVPALYSIIKIDDDRLHVTVENVLTRKRTTICDEKLCFNENLDTKYLFMRILTFEGISFQTGLNFTFSKKDPKIINWIKKSRKHYRPTLQMLELYMYYKEIMGD
ncbi:MAG: hypothetical protein RSA06_04725, partial [Erysipelotrichaceae bacterium]